MSDADRYYTKSLDRMFREGLAKEGTSELRPDYIGRRSHMEMWGVGTS